MTERGEGPRPEQQHEQQIDAGGKQVFRSTPRFSLIPLSEALELVSPRSGLPTPTSTPSLPGESPTSQGTAATSDQADRRRQQLRESQQRWRQSHPDQQEQNLTKLREKTTSPERARELAAARSRRYRARKRASDLTE